MLDPITVYIQGDLSRNDVIFIVERCRGLRVVEFGMGGSTLLLARIAKSLVSYETNKKWFNLTKKRIDQIPDRIDDIKLNHIGELPNTIPECDVQFVDGVGYLRSIWVDRFFRRSMTTIVHDSRKEVYFRKIFEILSNHFRYIDNVQCHVNDSNLIVIEKRIDSAKFVNWNIVEADDNRVDWNKEDYVPDQSQL